MSTRRASSHVNHTPDTDLSWLQPVPELRRQVHPRLKVNRAAVTTVIGALLTGVAIGSSLTFGIMAPALSVIEDRTPDTVGNGRGSDVIYPPTVPPCTDAIADAGGICKGEPQ